MAPTIITPKDLTPEILAALSTESGYLELLSVPPIEFVDYQREFLQDTSSFQIYLKSRQLGFSYVAAARTLARCQLMDDYTAIIASYKVDDAKEKIRYVKQMYDVLPDQFKKNKLVDNATSIEFVNKAGRKSTGTRIIAQGKGPIRGKGGEFLDVILDEFAFFGIFDELVYESTVPAFVWVKHGSLTIISTPLGRSGKFYEIWDGAGGKKFRNYKRHVFYWWDFYRLCNDVPRARREALQMHTLERVEVFGTEHLQELFDAMDLESFQQEFECAFIDDTASYFPLDMVYSCVMDDEAPEGQQSEQDRLMAQGFEDLKLKTRGRLGAGYDVGRRKDASELVVLDDTDTAKVLRFMDTYKQSDFELQERELDDFVETCLPVKLCIDENGLGMQLAEGRRKKHGNRVEPVAFTNSSKESMAVSLHRDFEKGREGILIPNDRDLISQIVSIRREVTSTGAFRYSADNNEKHHGDKFWALALANWALNRRRSRPMQGRVIGESAASRIKF
ncbi:terminase large subunit domain-containing protein [Alicyclobacillus fastidiosus]|uniref:Terminase family protein n=1 Tax=Alicyclobacillus fastidiosus TaxID=392011 RepID=A0ABV5AKU2_9BACL|nr:terminase family protein [Alicyclobacillus fastidiosus]WEH08195.1 terminase family protein [Alicyclobacillus fastidiosus]